MAGKAVPQKEDRRIYPVYVVFGKNQRRADEHLRRIIDQVLADADPQLSLSSYDGSEALFGDVIDELQTLPFLAPRRLVIVKDADTFITRWRKNLEQYLEKPSTTGVLLLMPQSFPGSTRLAKLAGKIGQVFACEKIEPRQLGPYLVEYAVGAHQLKMTGAAAAMLIELAGDDSNMLLSEIDKLAAYLLGPGETGKSITPADVQALIGNNRHYNAFNVIDAMTVADVGLALNRLDQMLEQDRESQYTAIGAFAWHFRRLYNARLLLDEKVDERAIISQLRIWARAEQFIRQVRQLSIQQIGAILQTLMKIDWATKTGAGTVRRGLEKLIVGFCQAPGRPG